VAGPDSGSTWAKALRDASRTETRQYAALLDWVRRRQDVPADAVALSYAAIAAPMLWLFVFGSVVELVVLHVLLEPLPVVRWVVFALSAWGLVFMLGFLAAYRTRPHVLTASSLRVRAGAALDIEVPLDRVVRAETRERDLTSSVRLVSVVDDDPGRWCGVGVSGRTNLQLHLTPPVRLPDPRLGHVGDVEIDVLGLWVDDPRAVRGALDRARTVRRDGR